MTRPSKEQVAFTEELQILLNKYSRENESNTPDFVLAMYLSDCLDAFRKATVRRTAWYGSHYEPKTS